MPHDRLTFVSLAGYPAVASSTITTARGAVAPDAAPAAAYTGGSLSDQPAVVRDVQQRKARMHDVDLRKLRGRAIENDREIQRLVVQPWPGWTDEKNARHLELNAVLHSLHEVIRDASNADSAKIAASIQVLALQRELISLLREYVDSQPPRDARAWLVGGRRATAVARRTRSRSREFCAASSRQRATAGARSSSSDDGPRSSGDDPPGDPLGLERHPRYGLVSDRLGRFLSACCLECGRPLIWHGGELICVYRPCPRWGRPS